MITRISEFQAGNETMKNVSYTVYYDSGRKVNYTGRDTLPSTVVTFLTAETTVAETVYINDDFNNCVNKRTVYTTAPAEEQTTTTINEEEAETMTRKELYTAITAAGVALHPCNTADTAPEDDTAIYYMTTEELTSIYADITEEQTPDTDTEEKEEEKTMFNNYYEAVTEDAAQYIRDNYTAEEIAEAMTDRDEFAEKLNDEMWIADEVTGNGSGSYTFDRAQAREYVLADIDTVREALRDFGVEADTIAEKFLDEDWEYFDVTARCYVLGQVIEDAIDRAAA